MEIALRELEAREADAQRRGVYAFFAAQVISLVFLQKLGITLGDKVLALALPLYLLGLVVLSVQQGKLEIHPTRLVLYLVFLASALLSQTIHGKTFSMTSMILVLTLYLPVIFRYAVDRALFLKCMRSFQTAMLAIAVIVFLQQISQRIWGFHVWPDMNKMVPEQFLIPNFNYWREMGYKVGVFQPNAFFFLEVSIVSQFLAIALIIEFEHLKRISWMVTLGLALLLTYAGTGLLVIACTVPFLLPRLSPRLLIGGFFAAVVAAIIGLQVGWLDQVATRVSEIQESGTSGYYRFVVPYNALVASFEDVDTLFFGMGAGAQVEAGNEAVTLPINKLLQEYGLITTVSFFLLFSYCLFEARPSVAVCVGLFVLFNVCGGSLAVPVYVLFYVLIGTFLRIEPDSPQARGEVLPATNR